MTLKGNPRVGRWKEALNWCGYVTMPQRQIHFTISRPPATSTLQQQHDIDNNHNNPHSTVSTVSLTTTMASPSKSAGKSIAPERIPSPATAPTGPSLASAELPRKGDEARQEKQTTTVDIGAKCAESSVLDLVFAMDCTGSMGSYIHTAQQSVREMIQSIVEAEKADVRFALVSYRDHPPQEHSYLTKVYPFTSSISKMRASLDSLSASGGGDVPEAVADALHEVSKLEFRPQATKIAVLIADAPPHGLCGGHDGFPNGCPHGLDPIQVCRNLAQLGVTLYAVGCEPAISPYRDFFQGLAHITGGQYAPLSTARGLSDLIVGGAREEIALERLQADVADVVMQAAASGTESGVEVSEEEQVARVYAMMARKGHQATRLRKGATQLAAPTPQSYAIAESGCLADVKKAFKPSAVSLRGSESSISCSSRARRSSGRSGVLTGVAAAAMPILPMADETYSVSREAVSMDQCRRMVKKSKARSGF